ncbi:hypothetical protein ACPW96_00360 [Micromonospora sp. DT81.3]|uniref:hypothetical protein n=1 Tax=Micromonospora sp. DT81.3 TaxID=3416523 RepID=UPI003CEF8836
MTAPGHELHPQQPAAAAKGRPTLMRGAVWIAIGALIAAAIVCVIWVLVGSQNDIVGRAFLTILLLAGFACAALYDSQVAPRRPDWYVIASMVAWVIALLAGALKIWMPYYSTYNDFDRYGWDNGVTRFFEFLAIVVILRLALLHVRLYLKAHSRYVTTFTTVVTMVTIALVGILVVMLLVPLFFPREIDYAEFYWRVVVALAILAAVGTALVPLINALSAPKKPAAPKAAPFHYPAPTQQWPTYADGMTPLPVMPDGTPDWNAYYTGYPTYAPPPAAASAYPAGPPSAAAHPAPSHPAPAHPAPAHPAPAPSAAVPPSSAPQTAPAQGEYPPPPPLPPRPPLP